MITTMFKHVIRICSIALLLLTGPEYARAVQWSPLARTTRHDVTLDEDSIRLTPLARLAVWLKFTPSGESQRKAAGSEYGVKGYRYHLEYYEVDCSEQSAVLGLIDIYGTGQSRLKRLNGGGPPEPIIPGSVLEKTAQSICSSFESEPAVEDESTTSDDESLPPETADKEATAAAKAKINQLEAAARANPDNFELWRDLGNEFFDSDLPEQAIEAYHHALQLRPDDINILNDQGAMFRQIGDFSDALANFKKALKLEPSNLESLYNLGYMYAFDLNDFSKANAVWARYIELDKSSETAVQIRGFMSRYSK